MMQWQRAVEAAAKAVETTLLRLNYGKLIVQHATELAEAALRATQEER